MISSVVSRSYRYPAAEAYMTSLRGLVFGKDGRASISRELEHATRTCVGVIGGIRFCL
jgi:hypothetical protein